MQQDVSATRSQRYRDILAILGKHGLAAAGAGIRIRDGGERAQVQAEHVRLACEELGTTFIKLGQMLSTRGDLLPPEYRDELAKLQDAIPPIDADVIVTEITDELGASPLELFASFDPVPLASASIGQVHAVRLVDGRDAVIKVRKPGTRALVERDLDILTQLATSAEKHFPYIADYDVEGLVEEFGDTLRAELDYTREARNIDAFRSIFARERGFALPEVIWDRSTAHVLTLTLVGGAKACDQLSLTKRRQATAAQRIARFVLEPAFMHGIFHADPHPGNILIGDDGTVGFIDFGMVGRLSDETRRKLADVFMAMERHDVQRLADRLIDLAPPLAPVDRVAFGAQLGRLLERYMSSSLERVQMGAALGEMLDLIRDYGLRLPSAIALFFKAIAMSEGTILAIAPDKTMSSFLEPIATKVGVSQLDPEQWADRARRAAMEAAELSMELPRRADRVLADVERGNLRIWTRIEDIEPVLQRFERIVERANASMIAAACIVGITILLAVYHPRGWEAVIGWVLWLAIIIAVLWVFRTAWATFRKGG
ncbi:MAG TPA: AarF/UbiB family protein [Candidatus Baltobacteraceae bacterium]|jgi:ubiquinone biosynthesis protein